MKTSQKIPMSESISKFLKPFGVTAWQILAFIVTIAVLYAQLSQLPSRVENLTTSVQSLTVQLARQEEALKIQGSIALELTQIRRDVSMIQGRLEARNP